MAVSSQKKRIALFSVHGDPLLPLGAEEAGGQNVYVREVARALVARGHEVDVFTRGRTCRQTEVHPLGTGRVIRLPAGPTGFISRNHLFQHLPEFVENVQAFTRWSDVRYDVLHTNYWLSGWVGMQLAERWGIPQVHTHHSLGAVKYASEGRVPPHGRHRIQIETKIMGRSARTVATSPQEQDIIRRLYQIQGGVTVIPCGIDHHIFRPQERRMSRRSLGLPLETPLLAYVGRFDPGKGIDTLIIAASLLNARRPVHLVLAGGFEPDGPDGEEFRRIRSLVVELGLEARATFLGRVQPDKLAAVYSAADLCVIPSHYESFGLVAIESMGCGTPVVASRVGGLQFAVADEETGILVPARAPEAFAAACQRLLDDPELLHRMGSDALQRVHRSFTWSSVASDLEALYSTVCRHRVLEARA